MTHTRFAFAHPVARCTAFAAVVAIGALGMSAPAAASPVSTTTPDTASATLTEQLEDVSTTAEAQVVLTDAGAQFDDARFDNAQFDDKSRKALSRATGTLVKAKHLTSAAKLPDDRADKISKATTEVSSLVVAVAGSHDDTVSGTAEKAAGDRTERASRSDTRPATPTAASAAATAAVAAAKNEAEKAAAAASPTSVTAAELTDATKSLSKLLKKPESESVSQVRPKKKESAAEKQVQESRDAKPSRGQARSAPNKSAAKPKIVQDLSGVAQQYGNGQIPAKLLCGVSFSSDELRCDAAFRAEKLNDAFHAAFDRDLQVNDAYRSYEDQVAVKASHGALAAPPGTSNHGWGQALDLGDGIETFGSPEYQWMKANAGKFGWFHPAWAEPNGSKPEAWHWEYAG